MNTNLSLVHCSSWLHFPPPASSTLGAGPHLLWEAIHFSAETRTRVRLSPPRLMNFRSPFTCSDFSLLLLQFRGQIGNSYSSFASTTRHPLLPWKYSLSSNSYPFVLSPFLIRCRQESLFFFFRSVRPYFFSPTVVSLCRLPHTFEKFLLKLDPPLPSLKTDFNPSASSQSHSRLCAFLLLYLVSELRC